MSRPIRVLVVDDSALVRQLLSEGLAQDPGIEVVGSAADPYLARDKIVQLRPDVLTLDVEMPRMDGVEFLRRLMPQYPLPVVMVSSLTQRGKQITISALEAGAVDFVAKPSSDVARGLSAMLLELRSKIKIASTVNVAHWKGKRSELPKRLSAGPSALAESTDKVIAIGASTGGTEAIKRVVSQFPRQIPGVVIVQHMPAGFTRMYAESLNQVCSAEVREARTGDRIMPGVVLLAPGELQMRVVRSGGRYEVACQPGHRLHHHIDRRTVSAHLGARTLAQDEASSVVFGMPKVAFEIGAAERLVPLNGIASAVLQLLRKERAA